MRFNAYDLLSEAGSYLTTASPHNPNYATGIGKVRALTKAWSLLRAGGKFVADRHLG
jgi:hypothetical protein